MRRTLVVAAVLQGIGVTAAFSVPFILATTLGTAAQGEFALYKSTIDFHTALLSLGMPTATVLALNRNLIPRLQILKWSPALALAAGAISIGTTAAYLSRHDIAGPLSLRSSALLLGVAIASTILYLQLRAILLTITENFLFSLGSALPNLILLATIGLLTIVLGLPLPATYAVSTTTSCALLVALVLSLHKRVPVAPVEKVGEIGAFWHQSRHALAQAGSQAAYPFLAILLLGMFGATLDEVGIYSLAAQFNAGPNLMVGLLAPILFNRWTRLRARMDLSSKFRVAIIWGILAQVAAVAGLALLYAYAQRTDSALAQSLVLPSLAVCGGVFPLVASRILAPAFQATGLPGSVTKAWLVRLFPLVITYEFVDSFASPQLWACACLALGEYLALATLAWDGWSRDRAPRSPGSV